MEKVKTIKELGQGLEKMLDEKDVNFNDVRSLCTELEIRLMEVKTELTWGSLPKTKAEALKELESVRTRLTRASGIFEAAQSAINYRRSERRSFARAQARAARGAVSL